MAYKVLIEYTLVDGMAEEAERVRNGFVEAATGWNPGFGYELFDKGDNAFAHVASLESQEVQDLLFEQDFFKEFNEGMKRITGGNIQTTRLTPLGSTG